MVPGQVITQETIDFMRKLDVKEIHGYDADRGAEAGARRRAGEAHRQAGKARRVKPAQRTLTATVGTGGHHDRLVRPNASKLSGNRHLPVPGPRLLLRLLHLQGSRPRGGDRDADRRGDHRPARDHDFRSAQAVLLPDVPVRHRLRGRTAIRARHRAGRNSAGAVCRGGLRVLPGSPPYRRRQARRLRRRLRRGTLCRLADDLGVDGPCDRRDQPSRAVARGDQEAAGRDAGRLRGDLHLRHDRIRHRPCAARPGAARHRSRGRVQALRGEARRQEGGRRPRHGLAPVRVARIPRPRGRTGRRQDGAARPRRCFPSSGCSSSAFAVADRSWMRPPTP